MTTSSRQPTATAPERIAALATLPMFHKLAGRKVVLLGATEGALWKAELLAAAGARVLAVLPVENADFLALATSIASRTAENFGTLEVAIRAIDTSDFQDAMLAVADCSSEAEALAFRQMARDAGVLVNIVDKPHLCDVQFGSIVNRSPLIVSISTDGAAPVLGQAIRSKIEALLPAGLKRWAELARAFRPTVQQRELPLSTRRSFWQKFVERALASSGAEPDGSVHQDLTRDLDAVTGTDPHGMVTFVGAGPGDPELLTLKAMRALQSADVILFDELVSQGVLDLARREAERVHVGKVGHGPSCTQSDINALMVALALEGKQVVRLKSGDSPIFGRTNEEADACRAAGISISIIPGISAAQGAAASLNISLTDRSHASRVQYVTGHDRTGHLPDTINWAAIADPAVTTVIYMPRKTLESFSQQAIEAGLSPETPAVAILSATRANELRIWGTIASLPANLAASEASGPVIVITGNVLRRLDTDRGQ